MPWTAGDAEKHTKKADTSWKQRLWAKVANADLERTGDEAQAIRNANAAVAQHSKISWT